MSSTIQHKSISARMTTDTLKSLRNDVSFDLFWEKVTCKVADLDSTEPQLPRRRKRPCRYDDGLSFLILLSNTSNGFTMKHLISLLIALNNRIYRRLETLLLKLSLPFIRMIWSTWIVFAQSSKHLVFTFRTCSKNRKAIMDSWQNQHL